FYSVGKKGKTGEEARMVTFQVSFKVKEKFLLFRGKRNRYAPSVFTYRMLVVKSSPTEQTPLGIAPTKPISLTVSKRVFKNSFPSIKGSFRHLRKVWPRLYHRPDIWLGQIFQICSKNLSFLEGTQFLNTL